MKFAALALVLLAGNAMSAEEVKLPDWVPAFPDAKYQVVKNAKTDKLEEVILYFTTAKSPTEVKEFYQKGFESKGFKDLKAQSVDDKEDQVKQENLKADDGKRYWYISARLEKDQKETQVSLVYQTKM